MAAAESALQLEGDGSPIALDVEEVHRIFKLGDIPVAGFVDGLSATADNGRVSWVAFLRYMCDRADARSLRAGGREAVPVAGQMFDLFDEERQQEVELRVLASGLSVRGTGWVWSGLPWTLLCLLESRVLRKETYRYSSPHRFLRCSPNCRCSAKDPGRIEWRACSAFLTPRTEGPSHETTCRSTASRRSR